MLLLAVVKGMKKNKWNKISVQNNWMWIKINGKSISSVSMGGAGKATYAHLLVLFIHKYSAYSYFKFVFFNIYIQFDFSLISVLVFVILTLQLKLILVSFLTEDVSFKKFLI